MRGYTMNASVGILRFRICCVDDEVASYGHEGKEEAVDSKHEGSMYRVELKGGK